MEMERLNRERENNTGMSPGSPTDQGLAANRISQKVSIRDVSARSHVGEDGELLGIVLLQVETGRLEIRLLQILTYIWIPS